MTQNVQRSGTRIFFRITVQVIHTNLAPGAVLYCHKNLFYIYTKNIERVYKIKKTSCSSLLTKFITELIEDTAILTEFSIQLDR